MRTPGEMAAVLRRAAPELRAEMALAVSEVIHEARAIAEDTIGVGRREWPEFAESTEWDSRRIGPLERTGALKSSFSVRQDGLRAELVSSEPSIVYTEFGTSRQPPRPVLKPSIQDALRYNKLGRLRWAITRVLR